MRWDICLICGWVSCPDPGCCDPHDEADHPAIYGFNLDPDVDLLEAREALRTAGPEGWRELAVARGWTDADDWGYPRTESRTQDAIRDAVERDVLETRRIV